MDDEDVRWKQDKDGDRMGDEGLKNEGYSTVVFGLRDVRNV